MVVWFPSYSNTLVALTHVCQIINYLKKIIPQMKYFKIYSLLFLHKFFLFKEKYFLKITKFLKII